MAVKIFISYSHVDKWHVSQIAKIVLSAGHQVWFDYQLLPGQNWQSELLEKINWCEVFLYSLSPESVASEWCQWEFYQAVTLSKFIVPVLLQQNTKLPKSLQHIQYADFSSGDSPEAVAKLLHGIEEWRQTLQDVNAPTNLTDIPAQAHFSPITPDNLKGFNEFATLPTDDDYVASLTFSYDSRILVSAGKDKLTVWKIPQGVNWYTVRNSTNAAEIALSSDGMMLAIGDEDGQISLLSVPTGEFITTFQAYSIESGVGGIAFSPENGCLVTIPMEAYTEEDYCFKFWDVSNQVQLLHSERLKGSPLFSNLIFSPNGAFIGIICWSTPQLWSSDGKQCVYHFYDRADGADKNNPYEAKCLAFSSDSDLFAVGYGKEGKNLSLVKVWNTVTGELATKREGLYHLVESISFSADGRLLACGDDDGTLTFYRTADMKRLNDVHAHNSAISQLTFSPNGTLVATASYDGNIKLWGIRK